MSLSKKGKPGNKLGSILSAESRALFREKSGNNQSITMLNENNEILSRFNSIQIASEETGIRTQIIEKGKVYIFKYSNED